MFRTAAKRLASPIIVGLILVACGDGGEGAEFVVDGDIATMTGDIGPSTPDDVRALLEDHPNVSTIVLADVPGSIDDEANLEASRIVRSAGLATHVPSDGVIASGGVDFFLSGVVRTWDAGAMFGVHSWTDGETEGANLPDDDEGHDLFLDYYDEMNIDPDFYWFTLDAAPAADIHYMTDDELDRYGFATP